MNGIGKDLVRKIQNATLYGETAHAIYSPPYRPIYSYSEILEKKPRFAAVNILLYQKDNDWYFPLMLRTQNEKDRHSGQISLPGGSREESDKSFADAAIRETCEEIGIDKNYIRIIRKLSPVYIPPSNFYVHPFVSFTKRNPTFSPQTDEVVELIDFPLSYLLNLQTQPETMILPGSRGVNVPVIDFEGYKIWGATSMILSEFSHLLKKL